MKKYVPIVVKVLGGLIVALVMAFWADDRFWEIAPSLTLTVLGIGAGVLIAAVGMMIGTISNLVNLAVNELPKRGAIKKDIKEFVKSLDSTVEDSKDNTLLVVGIVFVELMLSILHGSLPGDGLIWRVIFLFFANLGFLLIWDVVTGMFTIYELHSEISESLLGE